MALSALAGVPGQGCACLGQVPFPDASGLEGCAEGALHVGAQGHEQESGGVLVDAVHKARARAPGFGLMPCHERIMNTGGAGAIGKHGNAGALV